MDDPFPPERDRFKSLVDGLRETIDGLRIISRSQVNSPRLQEESGMALHELEQALKLIESARTRLDKLEAM